MNGQGVCLASTYNFVSNTEKTKLGVGLKPEREVQLISSVDKISSPVQRSPSKHCGPDSVFFGFGRGF